MRQGKDTLIAGLVLIVVGLGLFLVQNVRVDESVLFLGLGGVFLAAYFYTRAYGLLIPGAILTGFGVGHLLDGMATPLDEPELFGLGLGFLAIYAIDRLHTNTGKWWPLIPGAALVFLGVADDTDVFRWFFRRGWPLALVVVGLFLVLRGLTGKGRDQTSSPS